MRINIPEKNYEPTQTEPSKVIREFKGINKLDPFSIQDQFATKMKNLASSQYPALTVRTGYSVLGSPIGTKILGLSVWKDRELHAVFSDGTWRKWSGGVWTALTSALNTSAEWSFCNFKGNLSDINLMGANGIDPIKRYDGSSISNLSTAPNKGNYIDQHDNRLYCAVNNEVYFSGLSLADDWTTVKQNDSDPGEIVRETNDGEMICGLKAGAGNVTVFFPNSSHELYGTSPSDFSFVEVAADIGAINNKCVVNLGGFVYFLGNSGIYIYSGGSRPNKDFSTAVQWYVDHMDKADLSKCCLGADGRRLYVTIPVEGTVKILEYDNITQQWYVWEDIAPSQIVRMGDTLFIGDNQGRILQLGGTSDNGSPIAWEWVSKPFTSQSMSQKIRWTRIWMTIDKAEGGAVTVHASSSAYDDNWIQIGSVPSGNVLHSSRICLSPSVLGNCDCIRVKIAGTGPVTIREISFEEHQLPIY